MLEKLFLQILNMSYIGGIVILFILIVRIFLKKTPRIFSYVLWGVALIRLTIPFSFESIVSLIPVEPSPISQDILYSQSPQINTGISGVDHFVNSSLPVGIVYESVNQIQIWVFAGSILWVTGILVLIAYGLISLFRLKRKLKNAIHEKDNIYLAANIETPFVLGIIKPKIYLPTVLSPSEKEYIILHEQIHIKRLDHLTRIMGFLTLSIHWFNPLVWIAFYISGKDMEISCDESVIRKMGDGVKKDYSTSLLTLATGKKRLTATPLAFGEGDTKGRIKNVMNYKQPKFWMIIVAIIILSVAVVGLVSNPKDEPETSTYIGHISKFEESLLNRFYFDPVEWITLEDNERIEELGIEDFDMPNGYYIYNPVNEEIVLEVNEKTEYKFIDWGNDFAENDEDRFHYSTTDKEEFIRYLNTYSDKAAKVPFWIVIKDGVVLSIEEQYVP